MNIEEEAMMNFARAQGNMESSQNVVVGKSVENPWRMACFELVGDAKLARAEIEARKTDFERMMDVIISEQKQPKLKDAKFKKPKRRSDKFRKNIEHKSQSDLEVCC